MWDRTVPDFDSKEKDIKDVLKQKRMFLNRKMTFKNKKSGHFF